MMQPQQTYKLLFSDFPDVVNIAEMCQMLGGISKKTGYRLLKQGNIKYFRIGRSYRIPKINILKYLDLIEKSPP